MIVFAGCPITAEQLRFIGFYIAVFIAAEIFGHIVPDSFVDRMNSICNSVLEYLFN